MLEVPTRGPPTRLVLEHSSFEGRRLNPPPGSAIWLSKKRQSPVRGLPRHSDCMMPIAVAIGARCHSCRQPLIQFRHEGQEFVTKQHVGVAQTAVLAKPAVLEVGGLDGEAGRNMARHSVEPRSLLNGEV